MLAFLLQIGASFHIPKGKATGEEGNAGQRSAIYFDILVFFGTEILASMVFAIYLLSFLHLSFSFSIVKTKVVAVNYTATCIVLFELLF